MKISKRELQELIKETLSETTDIQESDLVARKGDKSWADQKSEFKDNINELLSNIEDDKYSDATGVIVKTVKILNTWHKRIKEGTKGNVIDED